MHPTPRTIRPFAKTIFGILALVYLVLLVYIVFFARRRQGLVWSPDLVNLKPLINTFRDHRYIAEIGWWHYWSNIFGNVALFMPLPILLAATTGLRSRRWLLAIGVAVSVFVEATQYVSHVGVPDIDDVILNSTGVLLGVLLWELVFHKIYRYVAYQEPRADRT